MSRKFNVKSMVVGGIIGGMLTTGVGYAASQHTSIEVSMNPVTFMHNGQQLELEDGQQSFIYDSNTYVPLRWLSESIGKTVEWDEQNRTIYIADQVAQEEQAGNEEAKQEEENKQEQGTETIAAELKLDKKVYAPTDVLELTITNESSSALSFGRLFSIETLKDGKWEEVPVNVPVTMELIVLLDNNSFTETLDLSRVELPEGSFRLIKHVFDQDNGTGVELSVEFEVSAG